MKLSISILMQQECGGWSNIKYQVFDSENMENYHIIQKELIKKLSLKVNKKAKSLRKSNVTLTLADLKQKKIDWLVNDLMSNQSVIDNTVMDMTLNEWIN